MSAEDEAIEEESGSDSDSGSESDSSSYEDGEDSEDDTDEPVLKYSRFAKDVVNCLNPAQGDTKNVIECMAVHSKVSLLTVLYDLSIHYDCSLLLWGHMMVVLKWLTIQVMMNNKDSYKLFMIIMVLFKNKTF